VTIPEVLEKHTPDALRLFVLTSHYRSPLTYSEEALQAAERGVTRLREAAHAAQAPSPAGAGGEVDPAPYESRFLEAMDDDLNTAQACAVLFDLAREINRSRESGAAVSGAQARLGALAGVLGLTLEDRQAGASDDAGAFIELLIEVRKALRAERHYALADQIRQQLAERGIALEDSAGGTTWKRAR
jgi:cysteinyl-tRNA synthetase